MYKEFIHNNKRIIIYNGNPSDKELETIKFKADHGYRLVSNGHLLWEAKDLER